MSQLKKQTGSRHTLKKVRRPYCAMPAVPPVKWKKLIAQWQSSHYDGIRGAPPDWIPGFYRSQFVSAQRRAATFVIGQKVKGRRDRLVSDFVDAIDLAAEPVMRNDRLLLRTDCVFTLLLYADSEAWLIDDHSLIMLVYIFHATKLGPEGGLSFLTDSESAADLIRGRNVERGRSASLQNRKERSKDLCDRIIEAAKKEQLSGTPERAINKNVSLTLKEAGVSCTPQYVGRVRKGK